MAGRPTYEPTPADRKTVQNLAAAGIKQAVIAQCIGDYGVDEKTLRLHFRRELDISKTQVTALAVSKLVAAVTTGEAWAITFWLKCREQWTDSQKIDLNQHGAVKIEVAYVDNPSRIAEAAPSPSRDNPAE